MRGGGEESKVINAKEVKKRQSKIDKQKERDRRASLNSDGAGAGNANADEKLDDAPFDADEFLRKHDAEQEK